MLTHSGGRPGVLGRSSLSSKNAHPRTVDSGWPSLKPGRVLASRLSTPSSAWGPQHPGDLSLSSEPSGQEATARDTKGLQGEDVQGPHSPTRGVPAGGHVMTLPVPASPASPTTALTSLSKSPLKLQQSRFIMVPDGPGGSAVPLGWAFLCHQPLHLGPLATG